MCGPLMLALPFNRPSSARKIPSLICYHGGRLVLYAALGCLFGALGATIELFGYQQILSILLGLIIVIGVFVHGFWNRLGGQTFQWVGGIKRLMADRLSSPSYSSVFVLGGLNGLLPCGLVYYACAGSVAAGGLFAGMGYMLLFGLGTLPMLLGLNVVAQKFLRMLRGKIVWVFRGMALVLGVALVFRGAGLGIAYLSPEAPSGNPAAVCCH